MDNCLDNGTVLPSGLLGSNSPYEAIQGFNRSYKNTSFKAGIVLNSYAFDDPNNKTGLCTEYDVQVIEQFEDKGTTTQIYRNCIGAQGLGSIADYFEYNLRPLTQQSNQGTPGFKNQNGAIVTLLCLDGIGEKAIVVGNLIHPDRSTSLLSTDPHLQGEYNGMQIVVNSDGSAALTFQGATDGNGKVINSQGITSINISADGSFQVQHSAVTLTLSKSGNVTLTANQDINVTAQGKISITVQGDASISTQGDCNITSSGKTTIKANEIDLNQKQSGITTSNSHLNVIDLITGTPVTPSTTTFGDV